MPKLIDHEAQREQLAEAVWRLAADRGLESVSLREVAQEAGVSLGRVQRSFASKDEMLRYALALINTQAGRRVERRVLALGDQPSTADLLRESLTEVLGLEEDSRLAIRVQLVFFTRSIHDEEVAKIIRGDNLSDLYLFTADLITKLIRRRGEIDPIKEAELLWSTAIGLGTDVVIGQRDAREACELLDYYLVRLLGPSGWPAAAHIAARLP
ncbi:TetR/AcrR family transcriptional regulator [Microlunatus speluncae]|uniref:TetR/AcrR family transcriptional regulator n=1 Tax=Microlunatus speluncae TaxID=2594267 RepID=UPI0013762DE7|nr:TetR family transcriptional regulator [Microlunatus speluncae]